VFVIPRLLAQLRSFGSPLGRQDGPFSTTFLVQVVARFFAEGLALQLALALRWLTR
jgi:hypothetical protein